MADKLDRLRNQDIDSLREEFERLRAEVKAAVSAASDLGGEAAEAVKARAGKLADKIGETTSHAYDALAKDGNRYCRAVESRIAENPLATLAVALAVGVLIGRMLDRRES